MQNGRFQCKIALCLMKVCYRVSLRENCQRQSSKVFVGLTIYAVLCSGRPTPRNAASCLSMSNRIT